MELRQAKFQQEFMARLAAQEQELRQLMEKTLQQLNSLK